MYNTQLTRKYALQAATDLRDKPETRDKATGICINLTNAVCRLYIQNHGGEATLRWGRANDDIIEIIQQWPAAQWENDDHDNQYPVNGSKGYVIDLEQNSIWQNPRRLELLNWLIVQLENE